MISATRPRSVTTGREMLIVAGPADGEIAELREPGYRPEANAEVEASRLQWEERLTRAAG